MIDPVTGSIVASGFDALGSVFGGGSAPAAPTQAIAEGSTVTVGGLNVPAYPNFPLMQSSTGSVQQPTITQAVNNDNFYLIAGGALLAVLLLIKK